MAVERQAATGSILDFREEHLLKSLERLAIYSHTTHQNDTIYSDEFDEHPAVGEAFTRNFYGADEKRRLSQRTVNTAGKPRHVQTEYRYDALGRRVLLRSRTDSIKCGTSPVGPTACRRSSGTIGTGTSCSSSIAATVGTRRR